MTTHRNRRPATARPWQNTTHPVVSCIVVLIGGALLAVAFYTEDGGIAQRCFAAVFGAVVICLGIFMLRERIKLRKQQTSSRRIRRGGEL